MTYLRLRALGIAFCLVGWWVGAALAATSITGVVRDRTNGQIAAGDEVILFRMNQSSRKQSAHQEGLQEEARAKTGAKGEFTLGVQQAQTAHLLRVLHRGVAYDRWVAAGEAVAIDVYDPSATVQGLTGNTEIVRIRGNGTSLHVSDMIEIVNRSNPPLTQTGERTYQVYLPARAKMDSVMAAGPVMDSAGPGAASRMTASMISAAQVPGQPGRYSVNFPLRPGSTKFAFNYDVPYDGHAVFRPRGQYPMQRLAVMIPTTMRFASRPGAFQILHTGNGGYQVEEALNVLPGQGLEFEISGAGPAPALDGTVKSPPPVVELHRQPAPHAAPAPKPAAPSWGPQWWLLGAGAVLLGTLGLLFARQRRLSMDGKTEARAETERPRQARTQVEVLKEEFFQLEIRRLRDSISADEHATTQQALAGTIQRVLARADEARLAIHPLLSAEAGAVAAAGSASDVGARGSKPIPEIP